MTDDGRERWRSGTRARAVEGSAERRSRFATTSDIEVQDLYTPLDTAAVDSAAAL